MTDRLTRLADLAKLIQLAIDGLEDKYDTPMISNEALRLCASLQVLRDEVHPVNIEDEIAFVKRDADRKIAELREREVAELCESQTDYGPSPRICANWPTN
ncbi:hypothetical protein [Methyloceanibacter caenitepidi]|uniref:Uncharacterized protein n=1 Tax=Methyloceanibacter caenitepidi TaxID=1384459 RepID=A0A0A8K2H9_9HYPH|nr:hypothetical protein [Methyloceanibacter caenitepidi]BAQ16971.1 hypothetical protein GL4_1515 [Methyloceanibacter caenitepidi]